MSTTSSQTVQVVLPELGESVTEGVVVEWRAARATPCGPATRCWTSRPTRSTSRCPAPASGRLVRIVAQPGETVEVGALLAELETGDGPNGGRAAGARRPRAPGPMPRARGRPAAASTSSCPTWSR